MMTTIITTILITNNEINDDNDNDNDNDNGDCKIMEKITTIRIITTIIY